VNHEDVLYLELGRRCADEGESRPIRERSGLNRRSEFVAFANGKFTVAALRAWEGKRRRPTGDKGIAYGRALAECLEEQGLLR